jgi:hypothetical protein
LTNGCVADAASAFAGCGHAAAFALGSNVPKGDIRIAADFLIRSSVDEQRWRNFETERL